MRGTTPRWVVVAGAFCFACGGAGSSGQPPLPDGGDAGALVVPPVDGGATPDAGRSPANGGGTLDGGVHRDAGPAVDSGSPAIDSGSPVDGGSVPDAGDGGETEFDAGGCATGATSACTTSCGSTGTQTCAGGAFGACVPPAEVCNLADDDCSGYCDDILGCRIGVDRSDDSSAGLHFYTTTDSEAACCGYTVETYDYYYLYASAQPGLVPFYRCRTPSSAHLYTTDATCGGNVVEGSMGCISTASVCGSVPLYGLYNAASGDYLYTLSTAEVTSAMAGGYASQGTAGFVWPGACGGPNCSWPSPVQMVGSTMTAATGFPTAWYGFPLPAGTQSFASLSGSVSVTNSANLYAEVLFILQQLPTGACASGLWPSTTPEYGPPGAQGLGQFIVKAPAQGTFTVPIDFTLPGGLPIASCLLLGLNGGTVVAPHDVTAAASLTLTYTAAQQPAQSVVGLGGEFCFGQNWGCCGTSRLYAASTAGGACGPSPSCRTPPRLSATCAREGSSQPCQPRRVLAARPPRQPEA